MYTVKIIDSYAYIYCGDTAICMFSSREHGAKQAFTVVNLLNAAAAV